MIKKGPVAFFSSTWVSCIPLCCFSHYKNKVWCNVIRKPTSKLNISKYLQKFPRVDFFLLVWLKKRSNFGLPLYPANGFSYFWTSRNNLQIWAKAKILLLSFNSTCGPLKGLSFLFMTKSNSTNFPWFFWIKDLQPILQLEFIIRFWELRCSSNLTVMRKTVIAWVTLNSGTLNAISLRLRNLATSA